MTQRYVLRAIKGVEPAKNMSRNALTAHLRTIEYSVHEIYNWGNGGLYVQCYYSDVALRQLRTRGELIRHHSATVLWESRVCTIVGTESRRTALHYTLLQVRGNNRTTGKQCRDNRRGDVPPGPRMSHLTRPAAAAVV